MNAETMRALSVLSAELHRRENSHAATVQAYTRRMRPTVKPSATHTAKVEHGIIRILAVIVDDGTNPAYRIGEVHFYTDRVVWYDLTCNGNLTNPVEFPPCKTFSVERMRRCAGVAGRVYSKRIA